jgi:hypothetical protein
MADEEMEDGASREHEESGEEYDENADEDFHPEEAPADDDEPSSSDTDTNEVTAAKAVPQRPTKRKSQATELELDSGDEITIKERTTKRRKKTTIREDEDSGGEGGTVRTRAQRVAQKEERRNRKKGVRDGAVVTIDVDRVWADLSSIPIGRVAVPPPHIEGHDPTAAAADDEDSHDADPAAYSSHDLVTIQRAVNYAGALRTVDVEVPRQSKEARDFFAAHPDHERDPERKRTTPTTSQPGVVDVHRPVRRPSMFEPNPTGLVKGVPPEKLRLRAPSRLDVLMALKREEAKRNGQKMSTVQMSQYDWKSYVAQEGIREELDVYERSGNRFLAREAFLDRAAGAREQAARDARSRL